MCIYIYIHIHIYIYVYDITIIVSIIIFGLGLEDERLLRDDGLLAGGDVVGLAAERRLAP